MATAVETRGEAAEAEVDRALVWAVRRRKMFLGAVGALIAGGGMGYAGLQQIEATAEERVLRRQAVQAQSRAVRDNGVAVKANGEAIEDLGLRMTAVEAAIGDHTEMTRTSVRLLMSHPEMGAALARDPALRDSAARAVSRDTE